MCALTLDATRFVALIEAATAADVDESVVEGAVWQLEYARRVQKRRHNALADLRHAAYDGSDAFAQVDEALARRGATIDVRELTSAIVEGRAAMVDEATLTEMEQLLAHAIHVQKDVSVGVLRFLGFLRRRAAATLRRRTALEVVRRYASAADAVWQELSARRSIPKWVLSETVRELGSALEGARRVGAQAAFSRARRASLRVAADHAQSAAALHAKMLLARDRLDEVGNQLNGLLVRGPRC
jgi:hypothetical protein